MGKLEPILRDTFRVDDDNPYSVFLFRHQLAWCPQKKGGEDMSEWINVKLKDVLSCEVVSKCDAGKAKSRCCLPYTSFNRKPAPYPHQVLEIIFAQPKRNSEKWTSATLELVHNEGNVIAKWTQAVQYFLSEFKHRPKNLLFFINPFGGRRTAGSIYQKHVEPILKYCKIKATVLETRGLNYPAEVLREMTDTELMAYDAVVAVGGDGTMCEVVNGLLMRKLDTVVGVKESDLQPIPLPVGVIAAGSTNAIAFTVHGTDDPTTGMLHIALGESLPLDIASVQTGSSCINRFIIGQMSYGYLADTMLNSEELRWLGPKRYDYAGFCKLMENASYEGTIDIQQAAEETRKTPKMCKGGRGCDDCNPSRFHACPWKRIEGNFIGISAANMSLKCPMSRLGMAPFAHLADGCMELILERKTTRLNHLRYLLGVAGDSRRTFALPFVERYRVKEFVFTPTQCNSQHQSSLTMDDIPRKPQSCKCNLSDQTKVHSAWNCDGELLMQPSVRVRVHSNLMQILARNSKQCRHESSSSANSSGDINDQSQCATGTTASCCTRSPSALTDEMNTSVITLDLEESDATSAAQSI